MPVVVSVDYAAKRIYLSADTVGTTLDTLDVYREVRALRRATEAHRKYYPMIIAGGNIEKIPSVSATPAYVQLLYGCRIVPYNVSHSLRVIRDTFTDDGFAGRDCFDRTPLSPSVSVDIDVDLSEVEIRFISTGDAATIAVVQAAMTAQGFTPARAQQLDKMTTLEKLLRNKMVTDPVAGTISVYDDDGTTVLFVASLWEDTTATQAYRGQGANRRERLA